MPESSSQATECKSVGIRGNVASPPDSPVDTHFHHRNAASRAARLWPSQSTEHPSLWQYLTSKQETSLTQNQ